MTSQVRPELPTASVGSSQGKRAMNPAALEAGAYSCVYSTYKRGPCDGLALQDKIATELTIALAVAFRKRSINRALAPSAGC